MSRLAQGRQQGLAVVEFAMILPILLLLFFGIVDLGRIVLTRQILINVSREASNLASRGTSPADAVAAALISAQPLKIPTDGYVIVTEVFRDINGKTTVRSQTKSGGYPKPSKIGASTGAAATLPATPTSVPPNGQSIFATEVYYHSVAITPLGTLINMTVGDTFYDVAFF